MKGPLNIVSDDKILNLLVFRNDDSNIMNKSQFTSSTGISSSNRSKKNFFSNDLAALFRKVENVKDLAD
jgi:hypothetical protein